MAPLRRRGGCTYANGDSSQLATEPTEVQSGCLVAVGLFALGAAIVIAIALLQERSDGRIQLGSLEGLQPGAVVYHATDHVFVVVGPDGTPLVLADLDPHNPPGRSTCRVTFRPELGGSDGAGRFFDACSGSTYDVAGHGQQGDGLDLRRVDSQLDARGQLSIAADDAASRVPSREDAVRESRA